MYALDTNIVSEITRLEPNPGVVRWLEDTSRPSLFLPSVVVAELYTGIELLPVGKKRNALAELVAAFIDQTPADHILGFGFGEAIHYARIVALRRRSGREIKQLDAQIAAIAAANQMRLVTRNVRDFENCGIEIINPWQTIA
jgi:predicted nucleic acid-binding protein